MAVEARVTDLDGVIHLDLYPGELRERVSAEPDGDLWPIGIWLYWDGETLARGENEFLGREVLDVGLLTDERLAALAAMKLPRITLDEYGIENVTVADAARWLRHAFSQRHGVRTS